MSLFPNPVRNELTIQNYPMNNQTAFSITNILGQVVLSGEIKSPKINIAEIPAGVYFLDVNNEVIKFVKE